MKTLVWIVCMLIIAAVASITKIACDTLVSGGTA
jgi:hypothetical protein